MMQKIIFLFLFSTNFIYLNAGDKTIGPYFVSPEPPFCSEDDTQLLCAATACAMVMGYWEEIDIVGNKDCQGYAEEFKIAFGTSDGRSTFRPEVFEKAFKKVAESSIINKKDSVNASSANGRSFEAIKNHMKYSAENDDSSPWDRPGVIVIAGNKKRNKVTLNRHVVLGWGCKLVEKFKNGEIQKVEVYYRIKDPAWQKENETFRNWLPLSEAPVSFYSLWWPVKCNK